MMWRRRIRNIMRAMFYTCASCKLASFVLQAESLKQEYNDTNIVLEGFQS